MNKEIVAVYGSLRKGFGNNRLLETADFVSDGITLKEFTMHSLGGFPAIIEGGDHGVTVEMYEVDSTTFKRLDGLEGYPDFYNRQQTLVDCGGGRQVSAWIYYMEEGSRFIDNSPVVYSNDWKEFNT